MSSKAVRPGERVKHSGIYESTKSGERATMVKREKAPPTPKPGEKWNQIYNTNPDRK